jgi:uncharacterized membrane protein
MKQEAGPDFNVVISNLLKYGVLISVTLVLAGLVILFVRTPVGLPTTTQKIISENFGKPTLDASTLLGGVASANPIFIIQLGLLVLLATPVARVVASVILFAAEKDMMYVAITLIVLTVLLFSIFVVGPIEARAA